MSTEEEAKETEETRESQGEEDYFSIEEEDTEEEEEEGKEDERGTQQTSTTTTAISVVTKKKKKAIEEEDDPDTIMSTSDSMFKQIPIFKKGITAADFAVKEVALKSVFTLRNCKEFYSDTKHASLPSTEAAASGDDEESAVKRHNLAIGILTLAAQENITLTSYIEESKDDADWPSGQMHLIVIEINERYKESGTSASDPHAKLDQKKMIRALSMKRNDDPNDLFEALAAIKLIYSGTKIPLKDDDMKDIIFEKVPGMYSNTLNTAERMYKMENPSGTFTYRMLQKEILKTYKFSQKNQENKGTTKEVVLAATQGTGTSARGGGRGRTGGRGRESGRGRTGGRGRSNGRGRGTGKYACHYCGSEQHLKRNCNQYKTERGELWCGHCDSAGHDDGMCFKLHPERHGGQGGSRQYSKFGSTDKEAASTDGEHSNVTIDVMLCTCTMEQDEEYFDCFTYNEYDHDDESESSYQEVEIDFDNGLSSEEDIIEIYNEDGTATEESNCITQEEWTTVEFVMAAPLLSFPSSTKLLLNDSIAVADTGSSAHLSGSKRGATNIVQAKGDPTQDASGRDLEIKMIYDLNAMITDKHGVDKLKALITRIRHTPKTPFTLLALNKFMEDGWSLEGNKQIGLKLTKQDKELIFDIPIRTTEGVLWCLHMKRLTPNGNDEAEVGLSSMSIKKAHSLLGHMNEQFARTSAQHLGWTVTRGSLGKCESCAIGKARQKNIGRGDIDSPKQIGDLWYIDGMSLKKTKLTKGPFPSNNKAVMLIEHMTGTGFLNWFSKKDGFINDYITRMNVLRNRRKYSFKRLRGDGAGENRSFVKEANNKLWKFTIVPEWTARDTPQANLVENPIYVCTMRARTLQAEANVPNEMKNITFPLAYKFAQQTRALEVIDINGIMLTRHEHLFGSLPNYAKEKIMKRWGEAVTIKVKNKMDPKSKENGITCFLGCYSDDRSSDCYTCYDPKTLQSYHSRDTTFLQRMYYSRNPEVPRTGRVLQIEGLMDVIEQGSVKDGVAEAIIVNENENEDSNPETDDEDNTPTNNAPFQSPRITTRGSMPRTIRPRRNADGSAIRNYGLASLTDDEIFEEAIDIEDRMLEETFCLGLGELSLATTQGRSVLPCPSFEHEEYVLSTIDNGNQYEEIEQAFGYTNEQEEYMLVAAFVKKGEEYFLVGATGKNYGNTKELQVMNYQEAMASVDKKEWEQAIKVEYEKMQKYNVFQVVNKKDVPQGTKLIDFTWAMKKKASGVYRARLAARGFKQVENESYQKDDTSSPVISEMAIKMIMTLIVLGNWTTRITDVEGAFLNGSFERNKEKLYGKVPQGFDNMYPPWTILLFLQCMYGTIQGALQWFRECCKALKFLKWERSKADPCLSFKWVDNRIIIFLLWVDDCLIAGQAADVERETNDWRKLFDTTDEGEMKEYVGCKVERTDEYIRLTQPVKVQRLIDEFNYNGEKARLTPAKPGSVLAADAIEDEEVTEAEQKRFRSITGMLNHMVRWTRLDCQNACRECSQFMKKATKKCLEHLDRLCNYIVSTKERGYTIRPDNPGTWDGTRNFLFKVAGESDSNYAKDPTRRSVNGGCTYLNGALIKMFCKMMPIIALSTTEAELFAAVLEAQDMMFAYHIMISMRLTVELPMILYVDNQGTVDLANNWSVGGRTRHVDVKQNYLRELKERGFLRVIHKPGVDITPDISTKNTDLRTHKKHSDKFMSNPLRE